MRHTTLLSRCLRTGFCLVLLLSAQLTTGQTVKTIDLISNKKIDTLSTAKLMCSSTETEDKIIMTYSLDKVQLVPDIQTPNAYTLCVDGLVDNTIEGEPSILMKWDSFLLPENNDVEIVMIDSSYVDIPLELSASKKPLVDRNGSNNNDYLNEILPYIGFYPNGVVNDIQYREYRGNRIMDIRVCPVKYDFENKILRVYTRITYEVRMKNNTGNSIQQMGLERISSPKLLSNSWLKTLARTGTNVTEDYLILTVPSYSTAANKFADWKRTLGFNVDIVSQSSWTTQSIKNTVSQKYQSSSNLQYLLIIGDHNDLPAKWITTGYTSHYTDLYYACMGGANDYTPDLFYGRLSVNNSSEAEIVVDKIINYEKNPILEDSFYNTALHSAYFQDDNSDCYEDRNFVKTSETIRDYLINKGKTIKRQYFTYWAINPQYYQDGTSIPSEIQRPTCDWLADSTRINGDINNGAFYYLYRGHGGYYEFGIPYNRNNIQDLTNGRKLPVVFSICCQTGDFSKNNCFAEVFLKKENGGCVGIIGATEDSMTMHNDQLAKGIINTIWPGLISGSSQVPFYRLGEILQYGENNMSMDSYYKYQLELYHILGDPSMMIYTTKPTVFQNVSITKNSNSYYVDLGSNTGTISFWDLQTNSVTKSEGTTASFSDPLHDVVISVSAQNKIPYIYHSNLGTTYIQNEEINGMETFVSNSIKVGSSVTSTKPSGPVVFDKIKTTLSGNSVEIDGETTIKLGTEFEILPLE